MMELVTGQMTVPGVQVNQAFVERRDGDRGNVDTVCLAIVPPGDDAR